MIREEDINRDRQIDRRRDDRERDTESRSPIMIES